MLELKDEENEDAELNQFVESAAAYKVKNINETHFMDTHSPSKRRPLGVIPVTRSVMASSTLVSHTGLNLMFNVVWSQKSLLIKVISTDLSSPLQAMDKVAIVMVIEEI